MSAHPAQLLTLYVLGLCAAAVGAGALYLLYRLGKPHAVLVRERDGPNGSGVHRTVVVAPPAWRRALAVLVPLLMLLWVLLGKFLVMPFYPHVAEPQAQRECAFSSERLSFCPGRSL